MADRLVDLDDFWRGEVALASFAAQLLTDREQADDSVNAGDSYGSVVTDLLRSASAEVLVPAEVTRVADAVGVDAEIVEVEHDRAVVRSLGLELLLDPSSLEVSP